MHEVPPAVPVAPPLPARQAPKASGGSRAGWGVLVVVIALVRGLASLGEGPSAPPRPAYQPPPVSVRPTPPAFPLDAGSPNGQFDIQFTNNNDPVWAPPGQGVQARVDADERTRRALEALSHVQTRPVPPVIPAPRPRAKAASMPEAAESLAPGRSKYLLHARPQEARVDPPPPRWGSGYTPPADFRLTTPADGTRVPGLADLARPPNAPPPRPQDDPAR